MKRLLLSAIFIFSVLIGFSQIPTEYYDDAQGFGGEGLKTALYTIIKGHTEYEYSTDTTDCWDILKETDRDPNIADNVILLYSGWSVDAAQEWNDGNGWSREHVWAKSHGQFDPDIVGPGAGTDVHHLRPADITVNTAKNNRWFAECTEAYGTTGSYYSTTDWLWKPRDEVKGDVARMMFYMATRYEGENGEPDLELIDFIPADNNSPLPEHAKLSDLLAWHLEDPVNDWERGRNEIIYSYQNNANPFIDHPEWVECIWNNNCTGLWFTSYPTTEMTEREDYSYSISASSSEALGLTITSETTLPAWLTFTSLTSDVSSATATLTGSPEFSDIGTYPISLKLSDGTNDLYQNFDIVVVDGNPITFTSNPMSNGIAGLTYSYDITVTGDVGAVFTLTGTLLPAWLDLTNNTGATATLTGIPAIEDIGLNSVILTVTDDTKKTITQEFDIDVIHPDDANTIIISQYYEGNSNDKYIELTNVGSFNLDLSNYYLGRWGNTDSPSGVFTSGDPLSGAINAGQTLVYKNSGAAVPAYAANSAFGTTIATYYNGNDPVALLKGGDTWDDRVDCIYASIEGGTFKWGDETCFYRKSNVNTGNKNSSVLDGSGEWVEVSIQDVDAAANGTVEYLGYHLDNSSSIRKINSQVKLYPNPVQNILFLETNVEIKNIEIINLTGQIVKQINDFNIHSGINVSKLEKGLYFLKAKDNKAVVSFVKFIKQ